MMTPPPSSTHFDFTLLIEWSFVIVFLIVSIYTAITINQEKSTFLQECKTISFGRFLIPVPKWWTLIKSIPDLLVFERTDTKYEWTSTFRLFTPMEPSIDQTLEKYLEEKKIEMDPDVMIETNESHLIKDPSVLAEIEQFIRIEGTATQDRTDRLYLDLCLIKLKGQTHLYEFISLSSVLNGMLEGPFFEEALKNVKLN